MKCSLWILSFTLGVCLTPAALAELPVPRAAKDFRIAEPSGKALSINDYRGKVVVVQFLYTTCPHCQATARMLTSLAKEFGPASLQVVGVAFNDEAESGPSVIEAVFQKSESNRFSGGIRFSAGSIELPGYFDNGTVRGAADCDH